MKRVLILILFATFLLAGCGLNEAAENTTTSLSAGKSNNDRIDVNIDEIDCTVFPILQSSEANIVCQFNVIKDAMKWRNTADDVVFVGSGLLRVTEEIDIFEDAKPFNVHGKGTMSTCPLEDVKANNIFYPCGLPLLEIDAEFEKSPLDGNHFLLEVSGVILPDGTEMVRNLLSEEGSEFFANYYQSVVINHEEQYISSLLEEEGIWFNATACQGLLIPGSDMASIIMIGELKDGSQFLLPGLVGLSEQNDVRVNTLFTCDGNSEGNLLMAKDYAPATLTTFMNENGGALSSIKLADGKSFLIEDAIIFGFNLGMPGRTN